jgi:hypothetical protein
MNSNTANRPDDHWQACPPGRLTEKVRSHRSAVRRRKIVQAVGYACALVLAVGVGTWVGERIGGAPEPNFGGITCSAVRQNMDAYAHHQLDADVAERMDVHVRECPACRELKRQMESRAMTRSATASDLKAAARFAQSHGDSDNAAAVARPTMLTPGRRVFAIAQAD